MAGSRGSSSHPCRPPRAEPEDRGQAASAFAGQCPTHVEKIDAAMAGANLSQERKAEVVQLRDEGKHQQSMETLAKAEKMLDVM